MTHSIWVTEWDQLYFNLDVTSQSLADNTSTVKWSLELKAWSDGRIDSSVSKKWSVTINGKTYSGTNYIAIDDSETKTLAEGTVTIPHNADGTKTISYSFSQQFDITFSGESIGTISDSGTFELPQIAQKSTMEVGNGHLGTTQTLTVKRNSTSLKHSIKAVCGSSTVYIKADGSTSTTEVKHEGTSIKFTPPLSWASQNTSGTSVSVNFTITTYSGSTTTGSNSYTRTFTIPDEVAPSCSITVSDANNYASTYGGYLKGLSKLAVVVNPTTSYGSPIASYSTTVDSEKYTAASFTTGVLKNSGSVTISAKVTDKRGRSGTATKTVTVIDYAAPRLTKLAVLRCNEDGTANTEGAFVKVTYSGAITSLSNKNTAKYQLMYKKTTEANDKFKTVDLSTAYTVTNGTYIFAADTGSSYNVQIVATDKFEATTRKTTASTGFTIMHFPASGKGMGLGKVCEFDGLDVGFDTRFRNDVQFDSPAAVRGNLKTWCFDDTVEDEATGSKYSGIARPDGTATGWTRVTQTGLLPYASGGQSSSLGTASWPFKNGYFKNLYVDGNDIFNGSGWKTATLTSDFVKYDGKDDNQPQYIKIGRLVEVRGAVSPTSAITGSVDAYTIFTLPEGYRPSKQVSILSPGSGANQWLLTITAAGLVRFARYNNGAGYVNATTTTWLPFHAMYFVD